MSIQHALRDLPRDVVDRQVAILAMTHTTMVCYRCLNRPNTFGCEMCLGDGLITEPQAHGQVVAIDHTRTGHSCFRCE